LKNKFLIETQSPNPGLAKVAVQCSAVRQLADFASNPIAIGMMQIATFLQLRNVTGKNINARNHVKI
jgi:hypothetical protein